MTEKLRNFIEDAWTRRAEITSTDKEVRQAVEDAIALLDAGVARVAEPRSDGKWIVNQWLKKAVLLSFRTHDNSIVEFGSTGEAAFDKVPSKFSGWKEQTSRMQVSGLYLVL